MRRSVCIFLPVTCLVVVATASAQPARPDYRTLVNDYRRYGASEVRKAAALGDDQIAEGRRTLAGSWEELRAAAMLHTEAMLVLANDEALSQSTRHLDAAVALLDDVVKEAPAQEDFAYRWFKLTELLLRQVRASASANGLSRKAKDRFSEDFMKTRASFKDAVVYEVQASREGAAPSAQALGMGGGTQLMARWLLPAAELHRAVLEKDPSFLTPALHLGRLHMLEGRLDTAAEYFTRALEAVDPRVRYLARLYLGSLDERSERFDAAEQRYRAALAEYPWGQSANLALAHLMERMGREKDARVLLAERFTRGDRIIEPLWTYALMPGEELGALFDELRAEVWTR